MPAPHPPHRSAPLTVSALAALHLVAQLRYLTVPLLVAHLGVSPDAAYRLIRRLTRSWLLRSVRWGRSSHDGPPAVVCVLTARGAAALVNAGLADRLTMTRLVRATSARARDVAAGLVTTLGHDLDVLELHALLVLAARARGDVTLWWPQWGLAFRAPLLTDPAIFDVAGRLRLLGDRRGTASPSVTYVPDAVVLLDDASGRRHVLFLEVETGKGGRTAGAIGAVKAAKMLALWMATCRSKNVEGIGSVDPALIRFTTWCPSDVFRDSFFSGARRVLSGAALPLVAASATLVPLHLPPGLQKGQVAAWMTAAAAPILGPVWVDTGGAPVSLIPDAGLPGPPAAPPPAASTSFDPYAGVPLFPL